MKRNTKREDDDFNNGTGGAEEDWDVREDKVEMSQHELYELIEQSIEKGTDKKETNKLIEEYNKKYGRIWAKIK